MTFWIEILTASTLLGLGLVGGISLVAVLRLFYRFSERRVLVRLGRVACPSCGQLFGFVAARDAKRRYEEQCQKEYGEIEREQGDAVFVDFDDLWEVLCPHCGQASQFDSVEEKLEDAA